MKTVAQVLSEAADTCERGWCQNYPATNKRGESVTVSGWLSTASRWCLFGAVLRACGGDFGRVNGVLNVFTDLTGEHGILFNDEPGRTQAEVVAKLREAATLSLGAAGLQ